MQVVDDFFSHLQRNRLGTDHVILHYSAGGSGKHPKCIFPSRLLFSAHVSWSTFGFEPQVLGSWYILDVSFASFGSCSASTYDRAMASWQDRGVPQLSFRVLEDPRALLRPLGKPNCSS